MTLSSCVRHSSCGNLFQNLSHKPGKFLFTQGLAKSHFIAVSKAPVSNYAGIPTPLPALFPTPAPALVSIKKLFKLFIQMHIEIVKNQG